MSILTPKPENAKYSYVIDSHFSFSESKIKDEFTALKASYPLIAHAFFNKVKSDLYFYNGKMMGFDNNVIMSFIENGESKTVTKRDISVLGLDKCELFAHILKKSYPEFNSENIFAFMNGNGNGSAWIIYPMNDIFFAIKFQESGMMNCYSAKMNELNTFVELACQKTFTPKIIWEKNAIDFMNQVENEILSAKLDKTSDFLQEVKNAANSNIDKLPKKLAKFLMFEFQKEKFKG